MRRLPHQEAQLGPDAATWSHAGAPDVLASPGDDAEPFDDFYRRELPHLLVLARALVGAAYAEDVAQEALLVAYRRWRSTAVKRSPAGYVPGSLPAQGSHGRPAPDPGGPAAAPARRPPGDRGG